jgi:5-methylthioribose kinase
MIEIDATSAAAYLRERGIAAGKEPVSVRELAGGVSNIVLLVTLPQSGEQIVLKQARGRLRVKEEWLCPVERIWREVEVLRICGDLLEAHSPDRGARSQEGHDSAMLARFEPGVPRVLWEDRENYLYAMTAAPEGHKTWKELLLAGETRLSLGIAPACGQLLAQIHGASWNIENIAARLDDRTYFDQLRLDPYYRHVARVYPDLAPQLARLIDSVWQHRRCLVHGDYSPKNLLVWPQRVMLIDFEVGHWGDPAFDLGFFLTHLVLKSIWAGPRRSEYLSLVSSFWSAYQQLLARTVPPDELASLERRMLWNLAGCLLARVDGKSPVDYLAADQQETVRRLARQWLASPPTVFEAAIETLRTWN